MSVIGSNILAGASGQGGAYEIEQSLRFNSADSAYLNRTPASAGNRKTWTLSAWIKRSKIDTNQQIFNQESSAGSSALASIYFTSGNKIQFYEWNGSSYDFNFETNALFRDPAAWYHIVLQVDTTQATSTSRVKLYVNGVEQTFSTSAYPSQDLTTYVNLNSPIKIGQTNSSVDPGLQKLDGYLAEVNFIDGSALDPTDFGEFDDNGVWRPIRYAGSYTGNSFYLKFASGDGTDSSGLGNTWTANNFTTSGTGTDVMSDTPTTNWCTLNPLDKGSSYAPTLTNGNLDSASPNNTQNPARGTLAVTSGKWYFEGTCTARQYNPGIGVMSANASLGTGDNFRSLWGTQAAAWYSFTGGGNTIWSNGSNSSYATAFATNDVLMIAYDVDAGKIWFGKNGTWNASGDPAAGTNHAATFTHTDSIVPFIDGSYSSSPGDSWTLNFGQRDFSYSPPSGFSALNTSALPAPTVKDGSDYFNTVLYTGNGSTQSITGVGFQPDWVWIKSRSAANSHGLFDAVRGVQNELNSNASGAEGTGLSGVTSFDSDGFSLGSRANENQSSATFAAWNWLAGGSGSSNTDGSITSTVSANPSAGFSIVNFTGTGSALTVGHGLGVAPDLMIAKNRDKADNWVVWHNTFDMDEYIFLESTQAKATTTNPLTFWNNTAPTSTVVSVGANSNTNVSGNDTILYCFAEVEGFSKFGSYTGNGSTDGPFVYCGFRPAWILIKRSSSTGSWVIYDVKRDTYNLSQTRLFPDSSAVEESSSTRGIDILSNGFKARNNHDSINGSGTYIFAAFAEHPTGGSGVSPATAR